jgi:histidinol-phosphate/aromatic aminotransferase/cobyric acid decarboxylase-like protein/N-acetylglutamate synthase-like GNAT family acetyltransferase
MPSPFYPSYEAATFESGAVPAYFDATASRVVQSLSAVLDSADDQLAAVILCHPCSPSGEVYDAKTLVEIATLVHQRQVPLLVDECYVDIYLGDSPRSILELVANSLLPGSGLVVMHTLSKRSAAPGIRSGFVAGDPDWISRFSRWTRTCSVSSALPICHAAERLWSDDLHPQALRKQLQANWDCADRILSDLPGYARPASGFFLWLPVADDEEVTRQAWSTTAVKVMPGSYLLNGSEPWATGGTRYVRIALVHEPAVTSAALDRLRPILTSDARSAMPAVRISVSPPGFSDWPKLLTLLRESFAYMETRIDPPSSLSRMGIEEFQAKATKESFIVATQGQSVIGCAFAALRNDCVYVDKVAVAPRARKKGIARALLVVAENLARAHNRHFLELQTRIELLENHAAFSALQFKKVAETAHPGYERPTSITMRKRVAPISTRPTLHLNPVQERYDD